MTMELIINSTSEANTRDIGAALAKALQPGDIIALTGDLGAGKTALVKGIAQGLGVQEPVTSPTFALVNEYYGQMPVYHFDVYRLEEPEELEDIGYEEYWYGEGITLIEWANLVEDYLPEDVIWITVEKTGAAKRQLVITGQGSRMVNLAENLKDMAEVGEID
ncbi:MAG: tRNA (adenosine(37)-N6)-threonylcarbamoyltransferase complex ATPase subunit type 1 TsaE [Firmicutes bacterium]|nr:tRNA (adenosine(37)-N6)-threonylcarbamoyltransferase complex ATPase subunit type 1 TsaE [Bacillota bacterium]